MFDNPQPPRSDSPAGDPSDTGQEPVRSVAPETVPNLPNSQSEESAGPTAEQPKTALPGTGRLLNRLTGSLRRVTEFLGSTDSLRREVEPDAPVPAAAPDAEPPTAMESQVVEAPAGAAEDIASEKSFIESLMEQPRRGTGQLRMTVTGVLRGPEDDDLLEEEANIVQPSADLFAVDPPAAAAEQPKVDVPSDLPYTEEPVISIPDIDTGMDLPRGGTGQLRANITGFLRGPDDLEELRAEIEADVQDGPTPNTSGQQTASLFPTDEDVDLSEIEALIRRQRSSTGQLRSHITGVLRGSDDLEGLRAEVFTPEDLEQVEAPAAPQQPAWDVPAPVSTASEDARLEDRFAMLGAEPEPPVVPPSYKEPELPEAPVGNAQFEEPALPSESLNSEVPTKQDDAPKPATGPLPPLRRRSGKRAETLFDDLRQTLVDEESEQRRRGTGGLFRRITGTLRRSTDNLRKGRTGPVGDPTAQEEPKLDDALLAGLAVDAAMQSAQPDQAVENQPETAEEAWEDPSLSVEAPISLLDNGVIAEWERAEQEQREAQVDSDWMSEIRQSGVVSDTATLPEPEEPPSDAPVEEKPRTITGRLAKIVTGILRGPESRRKTTKDLDISDDLVTGRLQRTMVTGSIKRSKTEDLEPEVETLVEAQALPDELDALESPAASQAVDVEVEVELPQKRGITGQLRSFITGILRSSEETRGQTAPLQTGDLAEDVVSDHMQQNLPGTQRKTGRRTSERRETFDSQGLRSEMIDPQPTAEELLRGMGQPTETSQPPTAGDLERDLPEDRFGMFFGAETVARAYTPKGETGDLDDLLQETPQVPVIDDSNELRPEDIWGGFDQPVDARRQDEPIWFVPDEEGEGEGAQSRVIPSMFGDITEDALIAAYLGGETAQREVERSTGEQMSVEDLRSIALQDYSETWEETTQVAEIPAGETDETVEEVAEPEEKKGLWAKIASLTVLQKILLAEVLLIIMLLPFLAFSYLRAPAVVSPVVNLPLPHALPAGVPYPTGVTLTGGWYFDVQKSTFVEGKWAPVGGEWLEGTEVRRVLALPWNPQTDAVVQTFKPGDPIVVTLSNQDQVVYKITSVERRASTEADFLADRKLSLVVVLYDEASEDRWVITSVR